MINNRNKRQVRMNRNEKNKEKIGLTWQEWFENTGFLFLPEKSEGYFSLPLPHSFTPERPSYGSYAMAFGDFSEGSLGQDLAVGTPRGPDPTGTLTGKVGWW